MAQPIVPQRGHKPELQCGEGTHNVLLVGSEGTVEDEGNREAVRY